PPRSSPSPSAKGRETNAPATGRETSASCGIRGRGRAQCKAPPAGTRPAAPGYMPRRSIAMKTTASLLTLAIGLALAGSATAGQQDDPRDQDSTATQAQDERQPPTADPLDTMDEPLEAAHPMEPVTD